MFFQEALEPDNAFVLFPGVSILGAQESIFLDVRGQVVTATALFHVQVFLGHDVYQVTVFGVRVQRNGIQYALGESAHALSGVPENYGTGTHSIHNAANPLPGSQGLGIFLLQPGAYLRIFGDGFVKIFPAHLVVGVCREFFQVPHQLVIGFLVVNELLVIRKAGRVQHLKAVELRFGIQLQGRSRKKQQAFGVLTDVVHQKVLAAGKAIFANQVVGLVHNGHVPMDLQQVLFQGGLFHQKFHRNDEVVALHKGVGGSLVLAHVHKQALHITVVH